MVQRARLEIPSAPPKVGAEMIGRKVIVFRRDADGNPDPETIREGEIIDFVDGKKQVFSWLGKEDGFMIRFPPFAPDDEHAESYVAEFSPIGLKRKIGEGRLNPICFAFEDEPL